MAIKKNVPFVVIVCLVILFAAVVVAGVLFLMDSLKYENYSKKDFIDINVYQALFLTNDQIYFGHLKNISRDFLLLKDVYYVKINEEGAGQILKLGKIEPHGPKDEMVISKDQVLFWENLRWDSPVAETIKELQSKEK